MDEEVDKASEKTSEAEQGIDKEAPSSSNGDEAVEADEGNDNDDKTSEGLRDGDEEEVYNAVIKVSPSDLELSSEGEGDDHFDDFEEDDEEADKTVHFDGKEEASEDSESEEDKESNRKLFSDPLVKQEREGEWRDDEGQSSGVGDDVVGLESQMNSRKIKKRRGTKKDKLAKSTSKRQHRSKSPKEPKKRGRKKQPRRLDGRDDVTSEDEEVEGEEVPIRFGTNYHVLFKRKVLRYASTHSNSATAEKFSIKAKLVREWRKNKEKIEMECISPPKKRPRNDGYTVEEKLHAIAFASERSTHEARLLYNVDKRTIEKWKAKKDRLEKRLLEGEGNAIREAGSGCKPKFSHIEGPLKDWVVGLRLKGVTVNIKMILTKANKLMEEHSTNGQNGRGPRSSTWVVNFLNRHNLYHLIGTTLGHEDPREILSVGEGDVSSLANKIDEIPENPNKRHRRRITLQDKLNIIRRIEGGETQGTVAKSLSVATSTIQTIWSCRHDIVKKSLTPVAKPISSTLFWRKYAVIASALQDWIEQCNNIKLGVDAKILTDKAIQLSETYRLEEFRNEATEWLKIFCKRKELKDILAEFLGTSGQSQLSASSSKTTRELPPHLHPHPADAPYTPTSTIANPSESCDNDNSSNFHEAEVFNFDEFINPNMQRPPNHFMDQSSSSAHHHHSPIINVHHHHQNTNSATFNYSTAASATPVIVSNHTTSVPILEAMKCVGTLRNWIMGQYGPNNVELNQHLAAIENAVLLGKKRNT